METAVNCKLTSYGKQLCKHLPRYVSTYFPQTPLFYKSRTWLTQIITMFIVIAHNEQTSSF